MSEKTPEQIAEEALAKAKGKANGKTRRRMSGVSRVRHCSVTCLNFSKGLSPIHPNMRASHIRFGSRTPT